MKIYSSITDIQDFVVTSLGDFAGDYDIEAIVDEISDWHNEVDADGNIRLDRSGLIVKPEYNDSEAGNEAFWELVAQHDLGPWEMSWSINNESDTGTWDHLTIKRGDVEIDSDSIPSSDDPEPYAALEAAMREKHDIPDSVEAFMP